MPGLVKVERDDAEARRPGVLQHACAAPSRTSASTSATTASSTRRARQGRAHRRHDLRLLGQALHRRAPRRAAGGDPGRPRPPERTRGELRRRRVAPLRRPGAEARGTIAAWPKESFPSPTIAISATAPAIPATLRRADRPRCLDRLQRPLHDLRISVTDRCNFRCSYCMPKEMFDKHYAFLPHASLLSFEEITRLARAVRRPRRAQDPPHRRRAAAAPRPRAAGGDAGRAAHRRRRAARPDAHHQRLAAGAARPQALKRRRPRPGHGQPRRPRRRDLPAHERRRLPGRRGAGRHRRRASAPASARSRSTWSSSAAPTTTRSCRWRATSAAATSRCASSSTWTSAPPTAGAWTRCCPRPR